jgi:hypothetical protein
VEVSGKQYYEGLVTICDYEVSIKVAKAKLYKLAACVHAEQVELGSRKSDYELKYLLERYAIV